MGVSVSLGRKLENGLRVEAEYTFRQADVDEMVVSGEFSVGAKDDQNQYVPFSQKVSAGKYMDDRKIHSFMFNLIYDITINGPITPYLGVGLGVGWEEEAENEEFAYQILAGISYAVSPRVDLILGYRYFAMNDLDYRVTEIDETMSEGEVLLEIPITQSVNTHNFELGVQYSF